MPLRLPQPETPLHLYRHILREAGYLPPVIAPFFTNRAKLMFRRHRSHRDPLLPIRLSKGNFWLGTLRAAVAGDILRLEQLALSAFGRKGFRRRELLSRVLIAEPPSDSAALEAALSSGLPSSSLPSPSSLSSSSRKNAEIACSPKGGDWLDKWDTDKLLAVLRRQAEQELPGMSNMRIPNSRYRLNATNAVPPHNIWGRPFAPKPARTKLKKFWKSLAERTLPPLPKGEWELLSKLASGDCPAGTLEMPRRRPVAVPVVEGGDEIALRLRRQTWEMEKYLSMPTRRVDRKSSRVNVLRTGLEQPNNEFGHAANMTGREKRLGRRSIRRMFGRVLAMCSLMEPGAAAGKWHIAWGKGSPGFPVAGAEHVAYFAGVDEKGKLPKVQVPRKPRATRIPRAPQDSHGGGA